MHGGEAEVHSLQNPFLEKTEISPVVPTGLDACLPDIMAAGRKCLSWAIWASRGQGSVAQRASVSGEEEK